MARKKYKLSTLIKVGVISFFSAQVFVAARYPEYEKLKSDWYNIMALALTIMFLIVISCFFGTDSIIFQGLCIFYCVFLLCVFIYAIINMFKIWRFFFKERIKKEDKNE
jgi:purine-cytosine permease-like protein